MKTTPFFGKVTFFFRHLILAGDPGTTFYVILKGSVGIRVLSKTEEGVEPQLREVRVMKAGESFGELSLIKNMPRAATIVCKEDCSFAVLEKSYYKQILSTNCLLPTDEV